LTTRADEELARSGAGKNDTPPPDPSITSLVLKLSEPVYAAALEERPVSNDPPRPVKRGTAAREPAPLRNVLRDILRLISSLILDMGPSYCLIYVSPSHGNYYSSAFTYSDIVIIAGLVATEKKKISLRVGENGMQSYP